MRPALALLFLAGCFEAPAYHGPASSHFDGEHFFTPDAPQQRLSWQLVHWIFFREPAPWPKWVDAPIGPRPVERVNGGELRVTTIGHSTVLIQYEGLNILTDPVWSKTVGPFRDVGVKRHRPPAIRFEDLPPIDAVIISHNHYDHLDLPTLERLNEKFHPRIFAGLGNRALFEANDLHMATDMDWWQREKLSAAVTLISVPVQHLSMRGLGDRAKTLWTGFVIESAHGRVYFGGDTAYGPHFKETARRLGPMRAAFLPIGAYNPRNVMSPVHMDPKEAVQAHLDLQAEHSIAIHFHTFQQTDEAMNAPVEDLQNALAAAGIARSRFWALPFGRAQRF